MTLTELEKLKPGDKVIKIHGQHEGEIGIVDEVKIRGAYCDFPSQKCWYCSVENIEKLKEKEKYTLQQCRDQRISIHVTTQEQKQELKNALVKLTGWDPIDIPSSYWYVRTFTNGISGWGFNRESYVGKELFSVTKEIEFDQLILESEPETKTEMTSPLVTEFFQGNIIVVDDKPELLKALKCLEDKYPDLRWIAGQKPTGYTNVDRIRIHGSSLYAGSEDLQSKNQIKAVELIQALNGKSTESKVRDPKKRIAVVGQPHHIASALKDLQDLGFKVAGGRAHVDNQLIIGTWSPENRDKYNQRILDLSLTQTRSALDIVPETQEVFNLPQDWSEMLQFALAQKELIVKDKVLELTNTKLTLRDNMIGIEHVSARSQMYDAKSFKEKLDKLFGERFGIYPVEEVKIGCTTYTRGDYEQVVEFLK